MLVDAFVHDGRSAALESAMEDLSLEENSYLLREDWWQGETPEGEVHLVRVQLFERNEYAFWLGFSDDDASGWIHLYDEEGQLISQKAMQKGNVSSTHLVVESSGHYFIRVKVDSAPGPKAAWAAIYAYR